MEIFILNLKLIFYFTSIFIVLVHADNIRIPKFQWEKVDVVSNVGQDLPEERRDYAIGYSTDQDEIIIYGGRTTDNRILSDTWIFSMSSRSWRKPSSLQTEIGVHPPGRYGMVYGNDQPPSNSFRNAFVITGGKGDNGQLYNDVWSFDFIRESWVEIKATGNLPEPRYGAIGGIDLTKLSYLNQISEEYLIYSHGRNDNEYFTDTYILKLSGRSQQGDYSQLTAEWIKLETSHAPDLKDGATGSILSSDRLVAFGGCEEKGNCNNKGYFLDVNFDNIRSNVEVNASWKEIDNTCIRPKAYAASVRGSDQITIDTIDNDKLENDRLIIFGGLTEKKYGVDADGEISIFDMDKRKFFGVIPSSKSNNEFPKPTKGAKMISTSPKTGGANGFSIILYGGEPIDNSKWSDNIWKLEVLSDFTYYPAVPDGVVMADCYTLNEVNDKEEIDNIFDNSSTPINNKKKIISLILFIMILIAIPTLIITSRALNCFTKKWKIIFLSLGALSFVLMIFNIVFDLNSDKSLFTMKGILACLLLVYLIFPFIRPKQPGIDFNQGEVNAAGVPIASVEEKKKNMKTSSSTMLIDPTTKNKQINNIPSDINKENEDVSIKGIKRINIDNKYNDNNDNNNEIEKRESFLSPIFINPSVKEEAEEDDEAEAEDDEIEDEDELIKKKYLARANIWLNSLRGVGLFTLIALIILALKVSSSTQFKLNNKKLFIYIWIGLIAILYIVAVIIARKKHASMALLRARRISFRPSEPLEPNTNSWALPSNQIKRFSMVSESSYGKTSAYDDVGNVSNYSQSVRNYNNINAAQSTTTNVPLINGSNSNVSPTLGYAIPPLPVTPVYMNNNGLFSIQSNYKYQNQNQNQNQSTVSNSVDPAIYKASEITNIPASSSDYQSYRDTDMNVMNINNNQLKNINNIPINNEKYSSTSSVNSLNLKEEEINNNGLLYPINTNSNIAQPALVVTNNNMNGSVTTISNITNPSPQSQTQLLFQNPPKITLPSQNQINGSSPILEESPIQINTEIEQDDILDYPQRNNTIEDMNDKEVMMVMTVPKRKLAVVNMVKLLIKEITYIFLYYLIGKKNKIY